jgi:hypothetical protein
MNLVRGFYQFIIQPMITFFDAIRNTEPEMYWPIIEALKEKEI